MLAEGYTSLDDIPTLGGEDREICLKTGQWIFAKDMPEILRNEIAIEAIDFYWTYKEMGMPFGPWANNPEKLRRIVKLLSPLDKFYNPPAI